MHLYLCFLYDKPDGRGGKRRMYRMHSTIIFWRFCNGKIIADESADL